MASLLSWAGNAAKRVGHTLNNDIVKPIQRDVIHPVEQAAQPVVQRAQATVAQVNPLDSDRTYNSVMQRGASYVPKPNASLIHQVTHNGLTNFAGDNIVKPLAQFPIDASNQLYNHLVAPAIHAPTLTPTQVNPISGLSRGVGATGSLHQTVGSGLQTALTIGSGGLAKGIEAGVAKALPKAAPIVVKALAPKIASNAAIGSAFNASAAAGQGANPSDIAKSAAVGAALGAAVPVGAAAAKPVAKAISKGVVSGVEKASPAVKQATSLTPRTTFNDQLTLQDLSNHYAGTTLLKPSELSATIAKARQIGQRHGVDITSGSQLDRMNAVNSILDKVKTENRAISQGGYAKVPGSNPQEAPKGKPVQLAGSNKAGTSSNASIPVEPSQPTASFLPKSVSMKTDNTLPISDNLSHSPQQTPLELSAPTRSQMPRSPGTQGANSLSNNTPISVSPQEYIRQQAALQEAARKAGTGGRLTTIRADFKKTMVDSFAPIEDTLNKAQKAGATIAPENNIKYQIDRALRADTIAGQYIKDNGLARVIQSAPDTKALDQYMIAKHAADLEANGVKTGRNLAADKQLVDALAPQYEAHAQAINQYNRQLLDKAAEYGLVSPDTAQMLKQKYPNYVPANRIFGEGEGLHFKGNGSGKASISTQTVVQHIKGSDRQIESPLASIVKKTQDVIDQGERNKTAGLLASYKDLPGNPFGITPLRTAENVTTRIDLYSQAKELKPVQQKLGKLLSSSSKWAGKLETELNNLNKKGLDLSLSQSQSKADLPILSGNRDVLNGAKTIQGKNSQPLLTSHAITGTVSTRQFSRSLTTRETKQLVNSLVSKSPSELDRIKSKIATRENQLAPVLDQIKDIQTTLEGVKNNRQMLIDEARQHSDIAAANKNTFSVFKNGIKETYETTPEIAAAAKSLDKQQLGIIGQIAAVPTRILRLGATGLNASFALANVTKDIASAFINSEHPFAAGNPYAIRDGFIAAFNHGSKQYGELLREGAGGTSFDIARNAPVQNIKNIRAQRNLGTKTLYTVTHPSQLLRAMENTIGRSEEVGRATQYFANKKAFAAEGANDQQARILGANAARSNTVNFARAGTYGRVANSVLPYLNAGIQGSRTLLRNVKDRPIQTFTKIAIVGLLPTATTTAWNLSSPDRKAAYDDINEYEKQGNLIIVPPFPKKDPKTGRWNVIKIPVSQEIANMNNIVRNGIEAAHKDSPLAFAQIAGNLLGSATSLNTQSGRQLVGQLTPQAVKPALEATVNQNLFSGNKIVPDSQKNLQPKDQYGDYTSGTAKVIGRTVGVSPRIIDNAVRTSAGGLGQNITHLSDLALAKSHIIQPKEVQGKGIAQSISDRFLGATAQSEYTKADNKQADLNRQLQQLPGYQTMSNTDKAKALNRLQGDISKTFLPPTDGKQHTLSLRQQALASGKPDLSSYLTAQKSGGSTIQVSPKISPHSQKVLNEYNSLDKSTIDSKIRKENDYEYKVLQAKYENDKANGKISSIQDINRSSELAKAEVGSQFSKDTRDLYGLSKAKIYSYLTTNDGKTDKSALADQLIAYDQALYNDGVTTSLKFKNGLAPSTGGKSKGTQKSNLATYLKTARATNAAVKPPKPPKAPHFTVKTTALPSTYKKSTIKPYKVASTKVSVGRKKGAFVV